MALAKWLFGKLVHALWRIFRFLQEFLQMENTESQLFESKFGKLSEDEVKRRFVPFLKDFYKNRYEPAADSFSVSLDNVSESGLVADIVMTFRQKDETPFVCACEATSLDKADEVKFALNRTYFLWDAMAFGAFFSAAVYGFFYNRQFLWLLNLHFTGNLGLIVGIFTIGFFGWYFTMQGWRKYRYIYAVEQFKRYGADEQWIALADDVFPSPNDPYLAELKNQCIYNGFGLALVPAEGPVRSLNSPSRLGVFGKDRSMVHWVTRSQWYQKMTETMPSMHRLTPPNRVKASWNKLKNWAEYLLIEPFQKHVWSVMRKPFGQTKSVYNRFMSGQKTQKWVFVLCTLALLPMCYKVLTFTEEEVADLEKLQNWRGGQNPEDEAGGWVYDEAPIPVGGKSRGMQKQYPVAKNAPEEEEDIPTIVLSDDEEEEYLEKPQKKSAVPAPKPQPASTSSDPCAKIAGKKGWYVQESAFSLQDNAAARAAALRNKGIVAQSTPRNCFETGGSGFVVWLGNVQTSEDAAQKAAADFEKSMLEAGLLKGKLLVRKL
jgi:cell division septation protein DedD